ncbi:MAG: hypothetical protein P8Y71_20995 [Pseudolabrys sp.]
MPWPLVVFIAFILIAGFARFVRGRGAPAAGGGMPMQPPMMRLFSGLFGKQDQATPSAGGNGSKGQ